MTDYSPTPRTTLRRIPDRGTYDRAVVHSILDQSILCHIGVSIDGRPRVIPTAFVRVGENIYVHGSNASQHLKAIATGAEACITVTIVDSIVAARSGFNCAADYRSVVIYSKGEDIRESAEKERILDLLVQHMIPGHKVRRARSQELAATTVLRFPLDEVSAKVRAAGVNDFEYDLDLDLWAGVIPLKIAAEPPRSSPGRKGEQPVPDYATSFSGWRGVSGE